MNKKTVRIIITVLLLISINNYLFVIDKGNVRSVEFLSVFAIGALAGILLASLFNIASSEKK